MLLGGFWHGASWNFLIWGAYHGIMLSLHRVLVFIFEFLKINRFVSLRFFFPIKIVFTFFIVCIGWIFFRAATFSDSLFVIRNIFDFGAANASILWHSGASFMLIFAIVGAVLEEKFSIVERFNNASPWLKVLGYTIALLILQLFSYSKKDIPFIYFQF
jgi:alginate O-acetyltransferase complex protein AlgI